MPKWTPEEDAILIDMLNRKRPYKQIAAAVNRSPRAVYNRKEMLRVREDVPLAFWDRTGREAELAKMWERGDNSSDIARVLGCTRNAVIGKARRLGLVHGRLRGFVPPPPVIEVEVVPLPRSSSHCATDDCRSPAQRGYLHGLCAECNHQRILESENRKNVGKELTVGTPQARTA